MLKIGDPVSINSMSGNSKTGTITKFQRGEVQVELHVGLERVWYHEDAVSLLSSDGASLINSGDTDAIFGSDDYPVITEEEYEDGLSHLHSATAPVVPLFPMDPEFERLLAEEEEIERQTKQQHESVSGPEHSVPERGLHCLAGWAFQTITHPPTEDELEIKRHHRDFERISALCTLVREGDMGSKKAIRKIQNIVG